MLTALWFRGSESGAWARGCKSEHNLVSAADTSFLFQSFRRAAREQSSYVFCILSVICNEIRFLSFLSELKTIEFQKFSIPSYMQIIFRKSSFYGYPNILYCSEKNAHVQNALLWIRNRWCFEICLIAAERICRHLIIFNFDCRTKLICLQNNSTH